MGRPSRLLTMNMILLAQRPIAMNATNRARNAMRKLKGIEFRASTSGGTG